MDKPKRALLIFRQAYCFNKRQIRRFATVNRRKNMFIHDDLRFRYSPRRVADGLSKGDEFVRAKLQ